MSKNNLAKRFFSTVKTHKLTVTLAVLLVAQQIFIFQKNYTIDVLESQNAALEEDVYGIQDQLSELEDGASHIKMFQKEMEKILESINHYYPKKFVSAQTREQRAASKKLDIKEHIKNAYQKIFQLSSSQRNLQQENADLLASTIFIKRMQAELPSLFPVEGRISSNFGDRIDPITRTKMKPHRGLDIAAAIGTPVFASADGRITKTGYVGDLGNYIDIEHSNGFTTRYGHLRKVHVKKNDKVKQGQEIASVGNTGSRCTGAHLHFEVKWFGIHQDPKPLLNKPLIKSPSQIF